MPDCGDVPTWIAALAGVGAVVVGWWQLSGLNTTLRTNGFMAVLQIESDINARKQHMVDVSTRLAIESAKSKPNQRIVDALLRQQAACKENYLNAVDRLCFCILRDYVPEKDWRAEYRDCLANDITHFHEHFGANCTFTNIVDLHEKWKRT